MLQSLLTDAPRSTDHAGWPRVAVTAETWREIGENLREGNVSLLGLWAEKDAVACALYESASRSAAIASLEAHEGRLPSLAVFHAPAIRLERAIQDLHGLRFVALPDPRPWLDHGRWAMALHGKENSPHRAVEPYRFLPTEGDGLHQIPVGPVHAGIIEPGHFRFSASGETVVRLEQRLGYVHKGIERILEGQHVAAAVRIASRASGDSTVAFSWAYSRAVETALSVHPPARAQYLRAIMAETERIANHLGDFGAVCNDAAFAIMHAECGILREQVLRTAARCFGHRLMMDRVVPGGVVVDLTSEGAIAIRDLLLAIDRRLPELADLYDNTASLQDRTVGTGYLKPELVAQFACGGFIGRGSGRDFDTRRDLPYPPYDTLTPKIPLRLEGDVDARLRVRLSELQASLALLRRLVDEIPDGRIHAGELPAPAAATSATTMIEGFRGDILAYVRIGPDLRLQRCHLRDPSWFQWPLLEAAIEDNIVADFPLCNKSFNCSYSGHDL